MRAAGVGALAIVALLGLGCGGGGSAAVDEVEEVFTFDVERTVPEQRVPGSEVGGPLMELAGVRGELDVSADIAEHDLSSIQEIRLRSFTLRVTSTAMPEGDADDFGFVDSVDVYVEGHEGSSLPRILIASRQGVPDGATQIDVPPAGDPDLLPYADEGGVLTVHGTGTLPPDDVTFDGTFVLGVEAF